LETEGGIQMKARLTILTTTAVLAVSGPAAHSAGAAIPWDTQSGGSSGGRTLQSAGGCLPDAKKPPRTLAVIREGYSWRDYVHSYVPPRNVRTDAFDRRDGAPLLWHRGSYHPGAYVPGGAPIDVAKAIQATGKKGPGGARALQSSKDADFRYAR
jgi:hypothetical protein